MNFFERQRQVRRLSRRLVLLFAIAVFGIVAAVDLAVVFVFRGWRQPPAQLLGTVLVASAATGTAIGLAALFRMVGLRGGGGRVARELGGIEVPQDTRDPQLRRLRNVVEEIAIASGVPVPEVYVLEDEPGINAFAAGWSTSDAAVAVTRGALERLNRDELQGVIAHEFSHVVNGDMRLNIRLMGLLFGILFLTVIGRTLLYFGGGRGRDRSSNPLPLLGLAMVVAGFIGVFMGRLIQASVSRQREYLADASAVQFTRQTKGIAGALKKIGGLADGSKLASPKTDEGGHMLFGAGMGFSSLFSTHPPLERRIKVLEPSFNPAELGQLSQRWSAAPPSGMREDLALGLVGRGEAPAGQAPTGQAPRGRASAALALPAVDARATVAPADMIAAVAAPSASAYDRAAAILSQLPEPLLVRARRVDTVVPLVFGLLLATDQQTRSRQHALLADRYGQALADAAFAEANTLAGLHPLLRLPLAELAFPALRHRSPAERDALLGGVFALIHADGLITAFEYCLSRLLYSELRESMQPKPRWGAERRTLAGSQAAVTTLLAALAQAGTPDQGAAERAFQAGTGRVYPQQRLPYIPPARGVVELEAVWPLVDGLRPQDKELLVAAAVAVIGDDGVMTVTEIELLRTICALVHCPLPPLTGVAA